MTLREEFERETGLKRYSYVQRYAGADLTQNGFSDDYVKWLECKLEKQSKSLTITDKALDVAFQFIDIADDFEEIQIDDEMVCYHDIRNFVKKAIDLTKEL